MALNAVRIDRPPNFRLMATTKQPRPLSTWESFLIGGVAASCAVGFLASVTQGNSQFWLGHRLESGRGGKDASAITG